MAITHTPDTDVITARRNAMVDTLAWELIGMATDRAQEIMDLANDRAHAFLRSPEPTVRTVQSASASETEASPTRVLSLPLTPPAAGLHPAPTRPENGTDAAQTRKRSRDAVGEKRPAVASTAADGNRGSVKAAVLAHLQAEPGVAMTVNTVAKAVGKAAGSVGAALESLTKSGDIARVGDSPKAYAWSEQG